MPHLKAPSGLIWNCEMEGEGLCLLFLHGWAVNSRIWRQQFKYFSDRYRVFSVDLPGHGKTAWQEISLMDMTEDLDFLLKQLQCEEIGVVASSFGGLVGLKLWELNKERIKFFVFAGSQPKFCSSPDYPFGLPAERIHKLAGQLQREYPAMVNIFFRSLFTRQERESRRFKWVQTFRNTDDLPDKTALLQFLGILEKEDLRETFEKINCPVLFINGTEDYICQKKFYEELQDKMPAARFEWFEQSGHFPFLSQPHEFNRVMERFLDEIATPVGSQ